MTAPNIADRALVLFSGGQDSAVCLAWALSRFSHVETVGFDYGQRHAVELAARDTVRDHIAAAFPAWAEKLGPDHRIDLTSFGAIAHSALTGGDNLNPELPATFVPGRNLAFIVYAAALAHGRRLGALVGGMCETDYSGYPDCRDETLQALTRAINLGMAQDFSLHTPLMWLTKAQTWALAKTLGGQSLVHIVLADSHTCYEGSRRDHAWGKGCGHCAACELRAAGFAKWRADGEPGLEAAP